MAEPLLNVSGLVKRFGALSATDDLSLDVRAGEIHAVIGPNGAGKTTAIAQLSGEMPPDAGTIRFSGRDVTRLPVHKRCHLGLTRSYQITSIFQRFTAEDNVALAVQAQAGHSFRFWRPARRDPALRDGRVNISMSWALARAPTFRPPILPMASNASLKSPWLWRRVRACCCWMSRWRAWGRRKARGWFGCWPP